MKHLLLTFLVFLTIAALPFSAQAQYQFYTSSTGASGSLTVTGTTMVNQYYQVTGLMQISGSNNYQVTCAGGFSGVPGQRVLLIEMNSSSYTSYTGHWEIDTVQTSGNPCTIVSNFAVSFDPAASSTIQLITIPQYVDLTIANNGILTAAPYNDTIGGVLVFEVQDTFTIVPGGRCDVSGLGFLGYPLSGFCPGGAGFGGAGGAAGSGGAAGLIGGPGGGGPFPGDTEWIQCSGVGDGGNGSVYGSFGIGGCGTNGGAGGSNNSVIGSNPSTTTLIMGTGGQAGLGGWGGYGAGGGGGGGGGAGAQPGTTGGRGGSGGSSGKGGSGGGIIIFYASRLLMSGSSINIRATGGNGGNGGSGGNGSSGGNGGEGAGSCNGGGGGGGGQGGNGGDGGGGGGGGAIYRILSYPCTNYNDTTVAMDGGAGGSGGSGGYGGPGGLNADTSCTNSACSSGSGGGGSGGRTAASSGPNGSGGAGAAGGSAGNGGSGAGSGSSGFSPSCVGFTGAQNLETYGVGCASGAGPNDFTAAQYVSSGGAPPYSITSETQNYEDCGWLTFYGYGTEKTYDVTIMDVNGCITTALYTLDLAEEIFDFDRTGQTNTSCGSSSDGSYSYQLNLDPSYSSYSACVTQWYFTITGPQGYYYSANNSYNSSSGTLTGLSAGTYYVTITSGVNCQVISNTTFTINANTSVATESDTICSGNTFIWNGNSYTQSGTYSDTLHGAAVGGCDSVDNLNLTVYSGTSTTKYDTILAGQVVHIGVNSYSYAGTYVDTLTGIHGCDSIISLYLTVDTPTYVALFDTICQGSSVIFGGYTYSHSGTYNDTLANSNGDDSFVTLHLFVINITSVNIYDTICMGNSFLFAGHNLTTQGIYYDTLQSTLGCDSIVTLHLSLLPAITTPIYDTICAGSYFAFGGYNISTSGVYRDTLQSFGGCDSIVVLSLAVNPTSINNLFDTICSNSTVTFGGQSYNQSGVYSDTLTGVHGCDSIIVLTLTVNPITSVNIYDTICQGSSISIGGHLYSQAGIYTDTLTSVHGCDSIVVLSLIINPTSSTNFFDTICSNSSIYFGGHIFSQAGLYPETLTGIQGCDSIVVLNLTISPTFSVNIYDTLITGDTLHIAGQAYTQSGIYYDTLTSTHGCDSIVDLYLYVAPAATFAQLFDTICQGFSVIVANHTYTVSGTYVDTLTGTYGGDSIVTLNLVITQALLNNINDTIGQGGSVTVGTNTYTQSGTYVDTLMSVAGCDSVVALHLVVTTGIRQLSSINSVNIYPNPTTGSFYMEINASTISNKDAQISVTDMVGQNLLSMAVTLHSGNNKELISLSQSAASGVYIVQLSVDGQSLYYRLVLGKQN